MGITENHAFIKPNLENIIWRYLDLEKFESLLKDKSLFFCRSDKFSDPFEGTIPKREFEYRIKKKMMHDKSEGKEMLYEEAIKSEHLSDLHRRFKRSFIVNCWHINTGESDAMWRLYLKTNEGVAIQSNVNRLYESLNGFNEEIYASNVRYIEYDKDIWYHENDYPYRNYNLFTPIIHKRKAFDHENELRVFQQIDEATDNDTYWDTQPNNIGKLIPCNIETLIERIILPPTSDAIVKEKVISIMKNYNLKVPFEVSKLNEEPLY